MEQVTNYQLNNRFLSELIVFVHTPFCGTCKLARKMLEPLQEIEGIPSIYEMNASLYPDFMQSNQIQSVPCLLFMENGVVTQRLYSFESVTKLYELINSHR